MRDLAFTLSALRAAYAAGASPVDVFAEVHRRIADAADPGIFIHLIDLDTTLAAAASLGEAPDPARPLWGIPFAVKDNIDVAGCPTTAACPAFAYAAAEDAVVVARLRAAGGIPIGKTNLDQFATGLVGVRTPFPVPRNALDPAIVPGGSSSGSAVAVARGLVTFALGTDTAGSGRVPAALNNIVGLKPSLGAISTRGVVPACRTLDTVSIFALTVDDAWEVFRTAAGFDAADPYARRVAVGPLGAAPPHPAIGIPDRGSRRFFGDAAQERAFDAACEALEALGARLVETDFAPLYAVAEMLYAGAWVAERHAVLEPLLASDPDAVNPVVRKIVSAATGLTATDAFRGFYRLEELRAEIAPLIDAVDMLCVPSIPTFYSLADLAARPDRPERTARHLHQLRQPPRPLRTGGADSGRGPTGGRAASPSSPAPAATRSSPASAASSNGSGRAPSAPPAGRRRRSPTLAPAAGADEMEIVVCGAHMSGLPLNHELVRLGGRFLREARTDPGLPALQPGRRPAAAAGHAARLRRQGGGDPRRGLGAAARGLRRLPRRASRRPCPSAPSPSPTAPPPRASSASRPARSAPPTSARSATGGG